MSHAHLQTTDLRSPIGVGSRLETRVPAVHRLSLDSVALMARIADAFVIYGTGLAAFFLCLDGGQEDMLWAQYNIVLLLAAIVGSNLFTLTGVYEREGMAEGRMRIVRLLASWGCLAMALLAFAFAFKISASFSRLWFAAWAASAAVGMIGVRAALTVLVQRWIAIGRLSQNVAIVGRGPTADRMVAALERSGARFNRIVGIFEDRDEAAGQVQAESRPGGSLADLIALARDGKVDTIVLALPWSAEHRILSCLSRLASLPIAVRLAPDGIASTFPRAEFSRLAGVPMLNCFDRPLGGWRWAFKEIEDRLFALVLLLFFSPLLALVALLVKLDSPGPVFFRQNRYGFNNQLIGVYKFRTMHTHLTDANAETLVRPGDSRVTRLGAFLRKSSIDELPQLINVLKGEMSIVGPRPHALQAKAADRLYEEVVGEYHARHRVKPGITGWAQVKGWRGVTDTEEKIRQRVEHDLYYIENWSIGFDVLILAMTVWAVIRPSNAH